MRRNRYSQRARQSADADTLVKLAMRLSESGSRLEDRLWERRLAELINDRLARRSDDAIDTALDQLARDNQRGYDDLADLAEACAESRSIEIDGVAHDALLLVVPMLAWSRYRLPATTLAKSVTDNLRVQLQGHLAARDARVAVGDYLYSIDQLPEAFSDVRAMLDALVEQLPAGVLKIDAGPMREPVAMLADTRYVLAVVAAPAGSALFHWQETGVDPDAKITALNAFKEQATAVMQPVMTGCRYEVLSPQAFHNGLRQGDRELREFSLGAAVSYLRLAYEISPSEVAAAAGLFEDARGNLQMGPEVRIGLSKADNEDAVIEGVVWPLLGDEEEQTLEDIERALRALGITRITMHSHRFPLEFCDDCGAPMFPSTSGHVVHAEPPEDIEERPAVPLH
ncbi:MAG: DUF2863 family protein [Burkholderiaceae bacterium]